MVQHYVKCHLLREGDNDKSNDMKWNTVRNISDNQYGLPVKSHVVAL